MKSWIKEVYTSIYKWEYRANELRMIRLMPSKDPRQISYRCRAMLLGDETKWPTLQEWVDERLDQRRIHRGGGKE